MKQKYSDVVPWEDSTKWEDGKWYPLAFGSMWTSELTVVEGWGIYHRVNDAGDIEPIDSGGMTFRQAVTICENHNGQSFGLVTP